MRRREGQVNGESLVSMKTRQKTREVRVAVTLDRASRHRLRSFCARSRRTALLVSRDAGELLREYDDDDLAR